MESGWVQAESMLRGALLPHGWHSFGTAHLGRRKAVLWILFYKDINPVDESYTLMTSWRPLRPPP